MCVCIVITHERSSFHSHVEINLSIVEYDQMRDTTQY